MIGEEYAFSEVPSVDDFYEQLNVSVGSIRASDKNTLFDRSPLDFIAYALSLRDRDAVDVQTWIEAAKNGVDYLDAIVFCGIEEPVASRCPVLDSHWAGNSIGVHFCRRYTMTTSPHCIAPLGQEVVFKRWRVETFRVTLAVSDRAS